MERLTYCENYFICSLSLHILLYSILQIWRHFIRCQTNGRVTQHRLKYSYIHMQTHTFPHCFDCILSAICLFNEHFLRTYICFLFAWQVQTASGLLVSIFHRLSYVSKETHGQLNRTLGLGPRPWSGLWLLSGATDVLWYQNVLAVFEHLSHIRSLCTRKNSHCGWTACLLYHSSFFPLHVT